jgi:ribose-phosphate pyrophosphokinase
VRIHSPITKWLSASQVPHVVHPGTTFSAQFNTLGLFLKDPIMFVTDKMRLWVGDYHPVMDTRPVPIERYPGGEIRLARHLDKASINGLYHVEVRLESSDDIMALKQLDDILQDNDKKVSLSLPYIPYGRQDRREDSSSNQALGIKVFADILNTCSSFFSITTKDPHSMVTPALIKKLHVESRLAVLMNSPFWDKYSGWGYERKNTVFLIPDAGAAKETGKLAAHYQVQAVQALKTRDPATGVISNPVIFQGELLTGKDVIIFDDICDGGRTFVELAKAIEPYQPKSLHLHVTHGIFSKGLGVFDKFNSVSTSNAFIGSRPMWDFNDPSVHKSFEPTSSGFYCHIK